MTELDILNAALVKAKTFLEEKNGDAESHFADATIMHCVNVLIEKIDSNKSLLSAIVTSVAKKAIQSEQDIRLHRVDFEGGYSARTLDTKVTAPFFKQYFPKYANKESAFLTLATRERLKWTLDEGLQLKIRNKDVKASFLTILDVVQNQQIDPIECLTFIFVRLLELSSQQAMVFDDTIESLNFSDVVNIDSVIEMLRNHFETKNSSRLPVIAVYAAYQMLFQELKRFDGKTLLPLNVHTASDKHGYGDIEILNADGSHFETVEIKHNIAIDRNLIFDIAKKCEGSTIRRYYILTTFKGSFASVEEEKYIKKFVLKIQNDSDLAIIANGILMTIKYYLRFIENHKAYLDAYTNALIEDAKNSTEVKEYHISAWKDILDNQETEK
jgi:DNA (cytosine-5)-methyltransferase 1